jgi:hypothetical protein
VNLFFLSEILTIYQDFEEYFREWACLKIVNRNVVVIINEKGLLRKYRTKIPYLQKWTISMLIHNTLHRVYTISSNAIYENVVQNEKYRSRVRSDELPSLCLYSHHQ